MRAFEIPSRGRKAISHRIDPHMLLNYEICDVLSAQKVKLKSDTRLHSYAAQPSEASYRGLQNHLGPETPKQATGSDPTKFRGTGDAQASLSERFYALGDLGASGLLVAREFSAVWRRQAYQRLTSQRTPPHCFERLRGVARPDRVGGSRSG